MTTLSETTLTINGMQFRLLLNPTNTVAQMQRDVFVVLPDGNEQFIRSFFFDDIQHDTIVTFCEQVATKPSYRVAAFARTTDWAITNDLFLRNCFNAYYQRNPFLEQIGSLVRAYYFFKDYAMQIVKHPQYQMIAQHDKQMQPDAHRPDPLIVPIIARLNELDNVKTLASCQGVSDVFHYRGYDIMTVSPHARFAYVWFSKLSQRVVDGLEMHQSTAIEYTDTIYPTLQSTGDNHAFLNAIHHLIPPSG